jgi:YXWGXW repeat-containing protein
MSGSCFVTERANSQIAVLVPIGLSLVTRSTPSHCARLNKSKARSVHEINWYMKSMILSLKALGLVSAALLTGCVERTVYVQGPPGETVATEAPPAPQAEVVVTAPGPAYIWLPGYWSWHGGWVWIGGRWSLPPRPAAVWIGGRWVHRGRGFVWIGGRWR